MGGGCGEGSFIPRVACCLCAACGSFLSYLPSIRSPLCLPLCRLRESGSSNATLHPSLRSVVPDCTRMDFLLPFSAPVLPYSGTFTLRWRAQALSSLRSPQVSLGFRNSLHHHSELGLGERARASFSFSPQGQSLLPSHSPPPPKPSKGFFSLGVCLFYVPEMLTLQGSHPGSLDSPGLSVPSCQS